MSNATSTIETRRELTAYVHDVMVGSKTRWEEAQKHRFGEGRAKAYLLDVHQLDEDAQVGLRRLFGTAAEGMQGQVTETKDAGLYKLYVGNEILFLDAADPRFVVVHTTGYARATDRIMRSIVEVSPTIDRAWLPSPFLVSTAQNIGRVRRRTISFDSYAFWTGKASRNDDIWEDTEEVEPEGSGVPIGKQFSLDFRDRMKNTAAIDQLYAIPDFADAMSFSRVDISRRLEGQDGYSAVRIYNWGKLSGVGTSAELHFAIVNNLRNAYRFALERIERDFRLSVDTAEQHSLPPRVYGHPVSISFPTAVPDLALFAKRIFAGRRPFMLWGIPQTRGEGYITVQALDLHVDRLIYCELMPRGMRVYLKQDGCANSVARLYANLLMYFDARVRLWGKGEADALLQ